MAVLFRGARVLGARGYKLFHWGRLRSREAVHVRVTAYASQRPRAIYSRGSFRYSDCHPVSDRDVFPLCSKCLLLHAVWTSVIPALPPLLRSRSAWKV